MNAITQDPALREWIGREELTCDTMSLTAARKLAATLGHTAGMLSGKELPALWHWSCFSAVADAAELGSDGHPARGGFLPPVPLPRRMWAGGELSFHRPMRVGTAMRRHSRVADVRSKTGRSGELVFVTAVHEICAEGETCLTERQDIVYRPASIASAHSEAIAAPDDEEVQEAFKPDPVVLFRYSALTFNGHRIHYDRNYAIEVEGYPGLVVHGPLVATLLAGLAERHTGQRLARFSFKAVRPAFDGDRLSLCLRQDDDAKFSLWCRNELGHLTMSATASI